MRMASNGTVVRRITAVIFLALAVIVPAGAPASAGVPSPGSNGLGDGYYPLAGNGGYDVGHYDLDMRYAPATDKLFAHVTITATATQALSRFNLDFTGLRVRTLTVDGVAATWERRQDHELVVTPAASIADAAAFVVEVEYDGVPRSPLDGGARVGAVRTDDGVLIYGEPEVAAYWYPSNDHPRDKATFSIDLTVPDDVKAISNGRFLGRAPAGDGRTTWSWVETDPMATYLATAAIGHFRIDRYQTDSGLEVLDAIDPRASKGAARSLAKEARVVRFLQDRFGAYPFDDLGGIVEKLDSFALETQTRPVYPTSFFGARPNVSIVVHELAHQWFGDSVSLHEWQHMWLNEGFASYAEWLWSGEHGRTPQSLLSGWCSIPAGHRFWNLEIGDPGVRDLFAYQVYVRGAMTLQALRRTVGSADFFDIVRQWVSAHADSTASTDDFIALSESVSGSQLDGFFDEWLFSTSKPTPCAVGGATGPSRGSLPLPAVLADHPR